MKYRLKNDGEYELRLTRMEKRRQHAKRMKAKAQRVGREVKEADHLAVCSCSMCCNPRHNPWAPLDERMTMQERRHADAQTSQSR